MKYCCDCGHYIPGGVDHNCRVGIKTNDRYVCALKQACGQFVDKQEAREIIFPKIQMRKQKKRKTK